MLAVDPYFSHTFPLDWETTLLIKVKTNIFVKTWSHHLLLFIFRGENK